MKRWALLATICAVAPADAASPTLTLAFGGDVMFGRHVSGERRAVNARDALRPFAPALSTADVAFANLETGICDEGRAQSRFPLFYAPDAELDALVAAGVDVVSVANNHALDCGPRGLDHTVRELQRRGTAPAGVAPRGLVEVSDDVVVLAATMRPPPYHCAGRCPVVVRRDGDDLVKRVAQARGAHPDALLVVSLHWGRERTAAPAAWQRALARRVVDAGANAVAGHGPHFAQPTETYAGAPIMYSLGNLVFDDPSPLGKATPPTVIRFRRGPDGWRATE